MDADLRKNQPGNDVPIVCSTTIPASPGKTYRLRGRLKATVDDAPAMFFVHYWERDKGFWAAPNQAKIGKEWTDLEHIFTFPKPGDSGYVDGMNHVKISIGFRGETGSIYVCDLSLFEMERLDEWESWKKKGMDAHSQVSDPKFVGEADMRSSKTYSDVKLFKLRDDSPAFQLGFKQIPVEKIGPYQDARRVRWPIVEAEGAREKPLVSEKTAD